MAESGITMVDTISANDLVNSLKLIELSHKDGSIQIGEMANVGILYNRILSYINKHIEMNKPIEERNKDVQFLDKLEVDDIHILKNFIDIMKERGVFKNASVDIDVDVDDLLTKINKTIDSIPVKPIKTDDNENQKIIL